MTSFEAGGMPSFPATEMPQSLLPAASCFWSHLFATLCQLGDSRQSRPATIAPFKTLGTSNIARGGSLDDLWRVIIVKTVHWICGNWRKVKKEKLMPNGPWLLHVVMWSMQHDKGMTGVCKKAVDEDKN
jgi:hypothetical protein